MKPGQMLLNLGAAVALSTSALAPPSHGRILLPDGATIASLQLPDRIWVLSLHRPYAGLVVDGLKQLETRTWPWTKGRTWLAICAPKAVDMGPIRRYGEVAEARLGSAEPALVGLVWVDKCRPLLPEDEPRAFFYEPGRYAFELTRVYKFRRPVPIAEAGLKKAPQWFARVERRIVEAALAA